MQTFGGQMPMTKVKAHRAMDQAESEVDSILIAGNQAADSAANLGAGQHPRPSPGEESEASKRWNLLQDILHCAVAVAATWPSLNIFWGGQRLVWVGGAGRGAGRRSRQRAEIPLQDRHEFTRIGGRILCNKCLCLAKSFKAARLRTSKHACPGKAAALELALDAQH